MYTQCPECQIAFRITTEVLEKAGGRVRCGGCGVAFSAVDHLSEHLPGSASNSSSATPGEAGSVDSPHEFEDKSKSLLETLDQLAGTDSVRIEDTGVEWRVLDESEVGESNLPLQAGEPADEEAVHYQDSGIVEQLDAGDSSLDNASNADNAQTSMDLQNNSTGERRYDDDTQLPNDFADEVDVPYNPPPDTPQRRASDGEKDGTDFDTHQVDLVLGDDEDWGELLDDDEDAATSEKDDLTRQIEEAEALQVADDSAMLPQLAEEPVDDPKPGDDDPLSAERDEEDPPAAVHDEDELTAEEEADIVQKLRDSTGSFQKQIEEAQRALNQEHIEESDQAAEETEQDEPEEDDEPAAEIDPHGIEAQLTATYSDLAKEGPQPPREDSAEVAAAAHDDDGSSAEDDSLEQTMIRAGIDPAHLQSDNIETIVMEGDFVRGALDRDAVKIDLIEDSAITDLEEKNDLVDTYMMNKGQVRGGRRKSDPIAYSMMGGVVFLLLLLALQYIHASRDTFATYGAFNRTLGPIYRALGNPVTPRWNIKGWQFEKTSGSTDDDNAVLTIFSQIRNASDEPLPYPLVHVSLTDRWVEVIGSKVLEPADYLAGDLDPRKPVAPGDSVRAVIAIEGLSPEATGYHVSACYRLSQGRMRCDTEGFKH